MGLGASPLRDRAHDSDDYLIGDGTTLPEGGSDIHYGGNGNDQLDGGPQVTGNTYNGETGTNIYIDCEVTDVLQPQSLA